ncbi:MAG: beta-galactosidase, partial [Ignavibacteria bacterium]|nr:beta-galactosidase [Ignavibacteria bacterium]
ELDKYVWTNAEVFVAKVKLLNFSQNDISDRIIHWELKKHSGTVLNSGIMKVKNVVCGEIGYIGELKVELGSISEPQQFELILSDKKSDLKNNYRIWVFPAQNKATQQIRIYRRLTDELLSKIEAGEKVILVPDTAEIRNNSTGGLFTSDYWNYAMFKGISIRAKKPVSPGTMGLLINHKHPVFNSFPTGKYADWQWWSIMKNSRPIFLNATNEKYRPIVQVVDNVERASKLGLMFEFKIGKGAILVCSADLSLKGDVAIDALKNSIIRYVSSDDFNPKQQVTNEELMNIIYKSRVIDRVRSTNDESNVEGYFN